MTLPIPYMTRNYLNRYLPNTCILLIKFDVKYI